MSSSCVSMPMNKHERSMKCVWSYYDNGHENHHGMCPTIPKFHCYGKPVVFWAWTWESWNTFAYLKDQMHLFLMILWHWKNRWIKRVKLEKLTMEFSVFSARLSLFQWDKRTIIFWKGIFSITHYFSVIFPVFRKINYSKKSLKTESNTEKPSKWNFSVFSVRLSSFSVG